MIRQKIGTTLAGCGIVMMLFGVSALPVQGAEPARPMLQPSPRPVLQPTPGPRNGTTASVPEGHITGTVIDLTTGAPMPGVSVNIGGVIVTSDANGNYDRWVPVGTYPVALALAPEQGTPAQDVVNVSVEPDAGTVQHLNFRSPLAATPQPAPTTAPAPAKQIEPASAKPPKRLPRTGSEDNAAWMWLVFGMALLLFGSLVGFGLVMGGKSPALVLRTHAANSMLLRSLLSAPTRPTRTPGSHKP